MFGANINMNCLSNSGLKTIFLGSDSLVSFNIDGHLGVGFPGQINKRITRVLNGGRNVPYHSVPCNVQQEIVFGVSGFDFRVKPKDYAFEYAQNDCDLRGFHSEHFAVPYSALHDKCLLFDYEPKRIGLASRK